MKKGFTLIELMIVIAIIGILAAIAVPNFMAWVCRSRATEGQNFFDNMGKQTDAYMANPDVQQQAGCAGEETRNFFGSDGDWSCIGLGIRDWKPGRRYTVAYGGLLKTSDLNNDAALTGVLGDCSGQSNPVASAIPAGGPNWTANACGNIDNDTTIDASQYMYMRTMAPFGRDCMD